ncbi:flagellar basal body L-ring protein FlgH [Sphingomonas profundi]|uniref:flagellar basal body L-ring protein FlgH n=1 Tax=Alterirhizorhabdus profundi TaxID=2681549 RepID=UPI0012E8B230|nr:flagellar basal body L-ring protein FlgH [Sphingomonas profundi]
MAGAVAVSLHAPPAEARRREPKPDFTPAYAEPAQPVIADGAIFHAVNGYAPLTSGQRAASVGDVLTILLVERTQASKSSTASTDRNGNIGIKPPTTGPLSLFDASDAAVGATSTFAGKGAAAQSNNLSGEISVTVQAVYPNGTMLVRGQKLLTLNRGDENIQLSGIVRAADISPDNRVLSTRVADARIAYAGKGDVARASKPGWLSHFFSILSPF